MKARVLISAIMAFILFLFGAEEAEGRVNNAYVYSSEEVEANLNRSATRSVEALDYVAPLCQVIEYMQARGNEMSKFYELRARTASEDLKRIESAAEAIARIEEDLKYSLYDDYRTYSDDVIDLLVVLDTERSKAASMVSDLAAEQANTVAALRENEKSETKHLADMFKALQKSIAPSASFPAETALSATVSIRTKPELLVLPGYIEPLNEMIMWYWNVEHMLAEIIEYWSPKVVERIDEDRKLAELQSELKEELAGYDKKNKEHKEEMAFLKKRIAQVEKDRKASARAMAADSKELNNQIKTLHTELQAAYAERLNRVIIEMEYTMARIDY